MNYKDIGYLAMMIAGFGISVYATVMMFSFAYGAAIGFAVGSSLGYYGFMLYKFAFNKD